MRNFLLVEGSYEKRPLFFRKSRRGPSPIRNPLFKFRQMKAKLEYLRKKKERIKKAQIISYVKRNKFRESLFVSIHNKRSIRARRVLQKLKALNLISREQRNLQRLQYLYSRLSSLPLFNIRHKSSSVFKTKFRRIASKLLANYTQELYSKKLTDRIYKLKRQPFFRHQKNSK
jgi:predicted transcriptional regulator